MIMPNKFVSWSAVAAIACVVIFASLWFFKCKFCRGNRIERTLAIIKPDAVAAGNMGKIIDRIEQAGFKIISMKKFDMSRELAENFYTAHKDKPFFAELVQFMISGPIVVLVLEKENAIQMWRDMIGATDPQLAADGTIRKLFGTDITKNAVHGSANEDDAVAEINKMFPDLK